MAYIGEMQYLTIGNNTYSLPTGGEGSITTEVDPIFSSSPAAGITATDITNWNGKSSTDEKVKAIALPTTSSTYYLVLGSNSGTAETKNYSNKLAFEYSSSQVVLKVGDTTSNQKGRIYLYGPSAGGVTYLDTAATISCTITLPDKSGTVALTSDIPAYTDTKNTAGSTNSTSKLYLIGATEQSANPQTYSNNNLYYDSINGFYVKSPTYSNSHSCIKQDEYGCTNIYAYSSSDDMPLSTILVSSSEVFLANRSLEMEYNSSISINDGDIYLSPGANNKYVYIHNLSAPSNDTDAATKKYVDDSIPSVPSNIVNTITTTAGAHTAITSQTGNVSFNVPTTASDVGAAASNHTHGNITNGGDITATAPTIANGDQLIINDNSASKITNGPTFDGSTTTKALTPKGTWETFSNTDEKLAVSEAYLNASYSVLLGNGESSQTRQLDGGLWYQRTSGTVATANLYIGRSGHSSGNLILEDGISHYTTINTDTQTANRIITLPDKTGTVALTSDIIVPTFVVTLTLENDTYSTDKTAKEIYDAHNSGKVVLLKYGSYTLLGDVWAEESDNYYQASFYEHEATTTTINGYTIITSNNNTSVDHSIYTPTAVTLNGISTNHANFYAPTSAGTNGQYLKSNGSGAPTWTNFPTIPTETTVSGWGFTKNTGTLTGVTFAGTSMSVSSGVASITQANARTALGLATVATSGSYNDLSNKPTIPTNTDEKLRVEEIDNNTVYKLILSAPNNTASIKHMDSDLQYVYMKNDTDIGSAKLTIGNSTASGTAGNKQGQLILYGSTAYAHTIVGAPTASRTITLPNKTGTLALTTDIPTITLNGSSTTSPVFYAPTTAGTSGQYLKSNGSGAPSWSSISDSDENVKSTLVTTGGTYYIVGSSNSSTNTSTLNKHDSVSFFVTANTSAGDARLILGNSTASGTNSKKGLVRLYGSNAYYTDIISGAPSENRTITLPNATGTIALISDIPVSDVTVGGTSVVTNGVAAIASPVQIVRW